MRRSRDEKWFLLFYYISYVPYDDWIILLLTHACTLTNSLYNYVYLFLLVSFLFLKFILKRFTHSRTVGESSAGNAKSKLFSTLPPKNSTAFPQSAAAMSRLIASKEMNLVDVAHSFFASRDETAVDKRVREEIGETRLPRPGDEGVAASESGLGRSFGE